MPAGEDGLGPGGLTPEQALAQPPLRVGFSLLTVSRTDPAEAVFVSILDHTEPDLTELVSQPMAFPFYGRGRALYALVGKGINEPNISDACYFLVGPCSCQVKGLNPGTDLPMRVDWDAGLEGSAMVEEELPPLVSLATVFEESPLPEVDAAAGADAGAPASRASASGLDPMWRAVLWAAGLGAGVVILGTAALAAVRSRGRGRG